MPVVRFNPFIFQNGVGRGCIFRWRDHSGRKNKSGLNISNMDHFFAGFDKVTTPAARDSLGGLNDDNDLNVFVLRLLMLMKAILRLGTEELRVKDFGY